MITHREAEALISARLDQRLDPLTERELSAHLATCPDCRAFSQASRALATGLRELPYLPPSSTVSRGVMAQVEEGQSPWARAGGFLTATPGSIFSTLAVIAVVLLLGFFVLNRFVLDTGTSPGDDNQLASQPTVLATSQEGDVVIGTPEPTATHEIAETTAPKTTATTIPPTETMESEPSATDVPPTETEAPPTATLEPTAEPTELPKSPETVVNANSLEKAPPSTPQSTVIDLIGTAEDSNDTTDITSTPYRKPTRATSSEETSAPTATPAPTENPAATVTPTEEEAPPIEPLNGQLAETPADTSQTASKESLDESPEEATATAEPDNDEVPIVPIATGDGTGAAETTGSGQTIEPMDAGNTPASDQEIGDIEPDSTQSPEATKTATEEAPSDAPEGAGDLNAKSEVYGDIPGDPSGRLVLENGRMEYGPQAYPTRLTSASGVEARSVSTDDGRTVELCVDGGCQDVSSESAAGPASDTPLSWIDGGLFYVRDVSNRLTYHYLVPDETGTGVDSDTVLFDGGVGLEPIFPVYLAEGRLWIITSSDNWLVLSVYGGQLLSSEFANPHDLRFADSGGQDLVVGYVSGSQLVIAPSNEPDSPLLTTTFSGIDFDISPNGDHIVISTGSAIEIYDLNGVLVTSFASPDMQPGTVLWLDSGIIYHDDASGISMQIPNPGV